MRLALAQLPPPEAQDGPGSQDGTGAQRGAEEIGPAAPGAAPAERAPAMAAPAAETPAPETHAAEGHAPEGRAPAGCASADRAPAGHALADPPPADPPPAGRAPEAAAAGAAARLPGLAVIEAAAARAAAAGADLLLTPELSIPGYGAGPGMARWAAAPCAATCAAIPPSAPPDAAAPSDPPEAAPPDADPPSSSAPLDAAPDAAPDAVPDAADALAAIAARHGIALIVGLAERRPPAEQDPEAPPLWNSALFTDGTRRILYRKTHLYGGYEKALFAPGPMEDPAAQIFTHAGIRCAMLICYDVEFPENVRRLAQAGAELILVPTALPSGEGDRFVARHVVPVRAFENGVHAAYCNLAGADARFGYAGLSCVAAPDGALLAAAERAPEMIFATIDPAGFAAVRARNPYLDDLRAG